MRILVVQRGLGHYRYPFYQQLGLRVDLTVLHPRAARAMPGDSFDEVVVPEVNFGPLQWQRRAVSFGKRFDAVVVPFDVRQLSGALMPLSYRGTTKVLYWGIGKGRSGLANRIRVGLAHRADGVILYSYQAQRDYVELGLPEDKLFVAPNTIHVPNPVFTDVAAERRGILIVGTLHERKRVHKVIEAFATIINRVPPDVVVDVVGDGGQLAALQELAGRLGVADRVMFHGRVTDPEALRPLFARALAAVSPGQAGLSVLHSLANGVPFVTRKDAITGGEIEAVIDGRTGFTYDDDNDLEGILERLAADRRMCVAMGHKAQEYYFRERSIEHMVKGFCAALSYSLQQRK